MTRNKNKSPQAGYLGAAGGDARGQRLIASTDLIIAQSATVVNNGGEVALILRLGKRPEVRLTALTEQDEKELQPLATAARRMAAALEVRT